MKNTKTINGLSLTRKKLLQEEPFKLNNFSRKPKLNRAFEPQIRAARGFLFFASIVMAALIGFGLTGCDDGKTSCSHKWAWKVTTQAVIGASGLETESCTKCGVKSGKTKTIEQLTNVENGDNEQLTNVENGDNEQLPNVENGDNEQLPNVENGDNEQLPNVENGNNEQLPNVENGDNEQLPNIEDGKNGQLTNGEDGDDEQLTVINISEIKGVFTEKNNTSFSRTIDETDQFTGVAICNSTANRIKGVFDCVLTITLQAKDGYTLQGVEENFFTVEDAPSPATNAANSGNITVEFRISTNDPKLQAINFMGDGTDDIRINEIEIKKLGTESTIPGLEIAGPTDLNYHVDPDFPRGARVTEFNVNSVRKWDSARQSIITGGDDSYYIINIFGDLVISNANLAEEYTFGSVTGVKISIRGDGVLSLPEEIGNSGALLRINKNQMVCLHDLTLQGKKLNNDSLVVIEKNGTFIMHYGKITGNINKFGIGSDLDGGGVRNSGTFIMYSGEISNNSAVNNSGYALGGGVLNQGGNFYMHGGTIANNSVSGKYSKGGGIANIAGTVRITQGTINGNDVEYGNIAPLGAALYQSGGTVEYGCFIPESGEWVKKGSLSSINTSVKVVDSFLVK